MSEFNWSDHPIVNQNPQGATTQPAGSSKSFSWNDHPIVQNPSGSGDAKNGLSFYANRFADDAMRPVKALGTAVDYLDAPIRQAAAIPEKIAHGQSVGSAILDVPAQLLKGPSSAPTWQQIYAKSGVSDKPVVMSGLENAHPEFGPSDPSMYDDNEMVNTPSAAARLGFATNLALGGKGLAVVAKVPGLVGEGINAAKGVIASKLGTDISAFTPIENQDAVVTAAKNIGITDLPKAILTDNPTYQKLESGLSQSGSLPAKSVRDQYIGFNKGIDKATGKIADLKTPGSDYSIGQKIESDLSKQVAANGKPVTEMYQDVVPQLQKIPVDAPSVNSAFGALKRNPIFQTAQGQAALDAAKQVVANQPELNSLKEWRSTIHSEIPGSAAPIDHERADAIYDAITKIRDNSINATKSELPPEMHGEVDDLVDQLALADAAHASNMSDINSVRSIVGNKDLKSPSAFLNKLSGTKEADLSKRAANLDVGTLRNLQDKYPSVFNSAKQAKINDMVQGATNPMSGFSPQGFFKQYGNMDQEMKDLIFEPEMQKHIDSLQTVMQATPDKLGKSGTPEGIMMMDMFSPKRNILDYGIKKALEKSANQAAATSSAGAAPIAESASAISPQNIEVSSKGLNPSVRQSLADLLASSSSKGGSLQNIATTQPTKGPDKWANDGVNNLIQHTDDKNIQNQINQNKSSLLNDPKAKDLLIAASDLKPGTKAMDGIMAKIQNRIAEGGKK